MDEDTAKCDLLVLPVTAGVDIDCGALIKPAVSIGLVSYCPECGAVFIDGTDCSAVTEHPDTDVVVE